MRTITIDIGDQDIRGIRFRTEAVVADIDPCIADGKPVYIVGIPAVSILGEVLRR
jgi:hypothetical protein